MLRDIIKIDEDRCTGCGDCIPGCPEGALQIIDGKARLISDLSCDGLGACIGHCPEGAIQVERREAPPYNERAVMENIIKGGDNVILAHLEHLKDHGETEYLNEALAFLKEKDINHSFTKDEDSGRTMGGCPGNRIMGFKERKGINKDETGERPSALTHWPVQLHLLSPYAEYLKNSDLLLSADCTAYSLGDYHRDFLKGKTLAIACPKLDSGLDSYLEKLTAMIEHSKINTLTVMLMEVPCCGGLLAIAKKAIAGSGRKIPLRSIVVSIRGEILSEEEI